MSKRNEPDIDSEERKPLRVWAAQGYLAFELLAAALATAMLDVPVLAWARLAILLIAYAILIWALEGRFRFSWLISLLGVGLLLALELRAHFWPRVDPTILRNEGEVLGAALGRIFSIMVLGMTFASLVFSPRVRRFLHGRAARNAAGS